MEEKLRLSTELYRQRIKEIQTQQRKIKMLWEGGKEVLVRGGKRLRVEQQARMEVVELSSEEEEERQAVCVYPKGHGAIHLYENDLQRFQERRFLNDQIINLVLRWLSENVMTEAEQEETYVADSFLYEQLMKGVDRTKIEEDGVIQENINRILQNPTQTNGLKKAVAIIPVCEDCHWFLAVILHDEATSCMLLMDSIASQPRSHVLEGCRILIRSIFPHQRCVSTNVRVIPQSNAYDCGIHLLHNAETLIQHLKDHSRSELGALEEELSKPMRTRKDWVKQLHIIHMQKPKPIMQQPKPIMQQPESDMQYSQLDMQQTQPIMPEPKISTQQKEVIQIISEGSQWETSPGVTLINKAKTVWEVTEELRRTVMEIVAEVQKSLQLCNQRRLIFIREAGGRYLRFEMNRTTGRCKVISDEKKNKFC